MPTVFQTEEFVLQKTQEQMKEAKGKANPTPGPWHRSPWKGASSFSTCRRAIKAGLRHAYVMSLCRGGRWTFRTTHFTIHSMPSRTPLL